MKKTIFASAIMLASTGVFACSGPGCDAAGFGAAGASVSGIAATSATAQTSAVSAAAGNDSGFASQVAGAHATNNTSGSAQAICAPGAVDVTVTNASNGTTMSYANGVQTGSATGSGGALALQGGVSVGQAGGIATASDVSFGRGRIESAGGAGGVAVRGGVAQGSIAVSKNVDNGSALQYSGAGAYNAANAGVVISPDAANRGPSTIEIDTYTNTEGDSYSYAGSEVEDNGRGTAAGGAIQGSEALAYAGGSASEYARNRSGDRGVAKVDVEATSVSRQGTASGSVAARDGFAANAAIAGSSSDSYAVGTAGVNHTTARANVRQASGTDSSSHAGTDSVRDGYAMSGTIADAQSFGTADTDGYFKVTNTCEYGGCVNKPKKPKKEKGNNGFGDGSDGHPPGHPNGAHAGQDD